MLTHRLARLINISLRCLTLASKFFLIFFLARFLEPTDLGLYGLMTATISYALFLLGMDFQTFACREIIKHDKSLWGGFLKAQAALSLIFYSLFLPLLSLVFINKLLPWDFAAWFFVLLVLEHITQEISRFMNAISEQLLASVLLFLRSGAWAAGTTLLMITDPESRNLTMIFGAWLMGTSLALCLAIVRVKKLKTGGWSNEIDWMWIIKGLRVAIPFLVATLAIRGIFTMDRYWFEHLVDLEALSAYVLYMGVSTALMSFLDAGIFAFSYPQLIDSFNKRDGASFRASMKSLLAQTVLVTFFFILTALFLIEPLLYWINKPVYFNQQWLFPWSLAAIALQALSMVPNFGLYAQGHDNPIIYSHIFGLITFVLTTWLCSIYVPILAVPLGLCAAFLLILIWKAWAFLSLTPKHYR